MRCTMHTSLKLYGLFAQDAKAFMVAWRGGRQVAEVPRTKLNLPPGRWLGLTTAAGLAGALYFARHPHHAAQPVHRSGN